MLLLKNPTRLNLVRLGPVGFSSDCAHLENTNGPNLERLGPVRFSNGVPTWKNPDWTQSD